MEKIKLEVAGVPAVLYGKRSRKVCLYVHGKNGSAAEAARFARTACPAGWQVLAVDLPEHGTRKNSPEKLVPWVVTRELQTVYARMQPVWQHIRVYGVSIGAWFAIAAVAEVELKTRPVSEELGTRLLIAGSKVESQEAVSCPKGSNFSIKNLFFNIPDRKSVV